MSNSRAQSHHIYVHEHSSKIPDLQVRYGSREHSKDHSSVQRQSIHLYDGRYQGVNGDTRKPRDSVTSVSDADGNENVRINTTRVVRIEVRRPGSVQGSFLERSSLGDSFSRLNDRNGYLSNQLDFVRSRTLDNQPSLQNHLSKGYDLGSSQLGRINSQVPVRSFPSNSIIIPPTPTRVDTRYTGHNQLQQSGYGYTPQPRQEYPFDNQIQPRYSTALREQNTLSLNGSMIARSGIVHQNQFGHMDGGPIHSTFDICQKIEGMRLYEVLEIPEGEHIVENLKLHKTIGLHGTGRAEATKIIIRGEVHVVLNNSFDGFAPATRKNVEFFKERRLAGAGCEINLVKNRVVFSNLSLYFESSHLGSNPLIRVAGVSTFSAVSCIFSGTNYQTVFADDMVGDHPPKQRDSLRWITLESCVFLGFKTLFSEPDTSHNLFASRCQFKHFIGPILVSSPSSKIVMDNSSVAHCIESAIQICLPELPHQHSGHSHMKVNTMTGLSTYTSGNYPTPYQQANGLHAAGAVGRPQPTSRSGQTKNSFLSLRMMDFKDNRGTCVRRVGHHEAGFADRVDQIMLESCLFEKNSSGCIDIQNCKGFVTELIGCVFNHNEGKVIQVRNSGLTKIVNCGFNDNKTDFFLYCERSSLYFERTVCYRNMRGIGIVGDPNVGRYRLSPPCKIEIVNSRIDGVDLDGLEVKPCPNMRLKIHNNYIMACRNAIVIDSTGMRDTFFPSNSTAAGGTTQHIKPNIDFYNNDLTQCREWGLRVQGPFLMIPLRHDKIMDNSVGAIIAIDSPDLEMPQDPTYPPEIRGMVELNGQRQSQRSSCELI